MNIKLITHNYQDEVTQEVLPIVVEFFAPWCPKCAMMKDVVDRLATRYHGRLLFKKVNIDLSEETAQTLGIEIVPTFVIYNHGKILGYTSGVLSEQTLADRIFEILDMPEPRGDGSP